MSIPVSNSPIGCTKEDNERLYTRIRGLKTRSVGLFATWANILTLMPCVYFYQMERKSHLVAVVKH